MNRFERLLGLKGEARLRFLDGEFQVLAPGEFVRIVRTELDREALAGMGIDIETADGAEVPADVLLGEDDLPRGVRVLPDNGFSNLE